MTTYTAIADSEIDPESPGTTTLFTKLRDNPIAITEKAAGAPVLANNYIVTAMIGDGQVTIAKLPSASAGTTAILPLLGTADTITTLAPDYPTGRIRDTSVNDPAIFALTCIKQGTVRIAWDSKKVAANAQFRIFKNGTNIFTNEESTTSYVSHTTDQTFAVGDEVLIICGSLSSGGQSAFRNLSIKAASADYCLV